MDKIISETVDIISTNWTPTTSFAIWEEKKLPNYSIQILREILSELETYLQAKGFANCFVHAVITAFANNIQHGYVNATFKAHHAGGYMGHTLKCLTQRWNPNKTVNDAEFMLPLHVIVSYDILQIIGPLIANGLIEIFNVNEDTAQEIEEVFIEYIYQGFTRAVFEAYYMIGQTTELVSIPEIKDMDVDM